MIERMSIPTLTLYGIPNCDTVRRARAWLSARGVPHEFHDFKKHGVPTERLQRWLDGLDADRLLNRRGTTWRTLDAATQARAADAAGIATLLREHPSLIRRPVVEWPDGATTVGFDEAEWNQRLASTTQ